VANTIAVVFDFDDTLVPDSTTMLLRERGLTEKDVDHFWNVELKALVANGYDSTLGFLKLFLDRVGPDKPLGSLTNADLKAFGASLDKHFHPGLPELFDDLRTAGHENGGFPVRFAIVSGGLQAVIEGSAIVQSYFKSNVYGCVLAEAGDPMRLDHVKRAINFTEKTRYLFEINKGLSPEKTLKNPFLVNEDVPKAKRAVSLRHMIYVGDGLTDIPCFSLLREKGGLPFGVFDPTDATKAKRAVLKFLMPHRVISMNEPRYGKNDGLGALLRAAVVTLCNRIVVDQHSAEPADESE